jgi:hypothetical protein
VRASVYMGVFVWVGVVQDLVSVSCVKVYLGGYVDVCMYTGG